MTEPLNSAAADMVLEPQILMLALKLANCGVPVLGRLPPSGLWIMLKPWTVAMTLNTFRV